MQNFRISQITDIHITLKKGKTINGIDVVANLDNILKKIVDYAPDLLVLSGDLCFSKNDKSIYEFVKRRLDSTGLDYCVMVGNHDKTKALAKVFNCELSEKGDLYYTRDVNQYRLIFTDSSRHNISSHQLSLIKKDLLCGQTPIIFMHHPPAISNVPFMDRKYPLLNMSKVKKLIKEYKGLVPVFCGHYHNERDFIEGNMQICMTPSTYFQISDQSSSFRAGSTIPGWRNIVLGDTVKSEVLYLT